MTKKYNPYKVVKYDALALQYENKEAFTYFIFNGFQNNDISNGLIQSINGLDRDFTYSLLLENKDNDDALADLKKVQKQMSVQADALNTEDVKDRSIQMALGYLQDLIDKLNPSKSELLLERADAVEEMVEALKTDRKAHSSFSLFIKFPVADLQDAQNLIVKMESVASRHSIKVPAGYFIQDKIHSSSILKKDVEEVYQYQVVPDCIQISNPIRYPTLNNDITEVSSQSVYFGEFTDIKCPVFLPFKWSPKKRGHGMVIGTTRAGKTAIMTSFLIQQLNLGNRVMVVDPKGEYSSLFPLFPDHFDIDIMNNKAINIFDLGDHKSITEIQEIFQVMLESLTGTNLTPYQITELNSILQLTKQRGGNYFNTFKELINGSESLKNYKLALEHEDIVKLLSQDDASNSWTSIKSKLIRFSFESLTSSELVLFLTILVRMLDTLPFDTSIPTILVFDEASKFFSSSKTSNTIKALYRILASRNINIWTMEQDGNDYSDLIGILFGLSTHILMFAHSPMETIKENGSIPRDIYRRVTKLKKIDHNLPPEKIHSPAFYYNNSTQKYLFFNAKVPKNLLKYV